MTKYFFKIAVVSLLIFASCTKDETTETSINIDVLVNNAGFALGGFFEDLTEEEIRTQMETNFFGVQAVTREVLPLIRAQKSGWIINISSVFIWMVLGTTLTYNDVSGNRFLTTENFDT